MNSKILEKLKQLTGYVKVITVNGYPMTGKIVDMDDTVLVLRTEQNTHYILLSAISTVTGLEDEK